MTSPDIRKAQEDECERLITARQAWRGADRQDRNTRALIVASAVIGMLAGAVLFLLWLGVGTAEGAEQGKPKPFATPEHSSWNLKTKQFEKGMGNLLMVITKDLTRPVAFGDDFTKDMSLPENRRLIVLPQDIPRGPDCDLGKLVKAVKAHLEASFPPKPVPFYGITTEYRMCRDWGHDEPVCRVERAEQELALAKFAVEDDKRREDALTLLRFELEKCEAKR